jgi:glycerol-3-phosphate dehydrogenase
MRRATYHDAPQPLPASWRGVQLEAMAAEPLDVLVIGGGITGVGVALDAASRGLRVGIVERDDWACGTSSRSSKMIHGGLRYLATGDVAVVRESLAERARLQRNAAHLVRPLPMLLPSYGHGPLLFQRIKHGVGLWAYEALGHHHAAGSFHRWVNARELAGIMPGVDTSVPVRGRTLRGAHAYHDASADDARLVICVLRTAVAHGAMAANGTTAVRLLRDGERVRGAVVTGDAISGELELEARVVVNATGAWADRTITDEDETPPDFKVLPSKGIHLAVRRERVGIDSGIAFFGQTDNSNVFLEPWQDDLAFIGTTDTPYEGELEAPHATDEDIAWLLDRVNPFLREPIDRSEIIATWAGLRPLVVSESERGEASKDVSRRHLLVERSGLLTITGGKLTAYRAMAEETVDAAARQLGRREKSRTRTLALEGSRELPTSTEVAELARTLGIHRTDVRHLLRRHGTNVPAIVELVRQRPELGERLHPERPYLAAEAAWAISHEQVRDVEDVLARRTRITLETSDPQLAAAQVEQLLSAAAATTT